MVQRLLATIFTVFFSCFLGERSWGSETELCNIADNAISQAEKIRKLRIKRKVPCFVHNKGQIEKYLLDSIEIKIPPGKLEMEEYVYKAIGIFPENFEYKKGIVDLYLSQIGGYYEPEKDYFIMASWMPGILQTTIAVHEMTHALQDQHFNLTKFIDNKLDNSDEQFARMALVEGDATAVMVDYTRGLMGQAPLEKEKGVTSLMVNNLLGASMMLGNSNAPESLKMLLLFPYTSGLRFAHYLLQKGGYKKINTAFRTPPITTEEILHPEQYPADTDDFLVFDDAEMEKMKEKPTASIVYRDTLGEFMISSLLGTYTSDKMLAANAAAGWGGDRLVVFEEKESGKKSVAWKVHWDSEKDVEEFFALFVDVLKQRFTEEKAEENSWHGKSGTRRVKFERQGQFTTWSYVDKQ